MAPLATAKSAPFSSARYRPDGQDKLNAIHRVLARALDATSGIPQFPAGSYHPPLRGRRISHSIASPVSEAPAIVTDNHFMPGGDSAFSPPAFEPQLSRAARRARGVYYTPPEIVRLIVDLALTSKRGLLAQADIPPRIIDPACGAGEFLLEASRRIAMRFGDRAAAQSVFGVDIDPNAIAQAGRRLPALQAAGNLWVADALRDERLQPAAFDIVVGNPPYVNVRQLGKNLLPRELQRIRQRFRTARGNFDLYVLFIERAIELLRPGGRCGLIIPNKWATLDYARPCRELMLAQATIEDVVDLSGSKPFVQASVYPHVLIFRKNAAEAGHVVRIRQFDDREQKAQRVPQRGLSARAFLFGPLLDVESRVATRPLGEVATLSCGTPGYAAQRVARRLLDRPDAGQRSDRLADFITSGNIDRYAIRLGDVRYLKRTYARPQLPLDMPELTVAKRRLFSEPKIVIAGLSRRLEAAWDGRGLALGVQVYSASDCQLDPFYLLALLNSKLFSYLFATRYAAKRLAGGYLAINKGQLARLPVVVGTLRVPSSADRLAELAKFLSWQADRPDDGPHDQEIDRLVYRLYRLSAEEIARVEGHFAGPAARAA
jgi:SAM-dependent methyltransferase